MLELQTKLRLQAEEIGGWYVDVCWYQGKNTPTEKTMEATGFPKAPFQMVVSDGNRWMKVHYGEGDKQPYLDYGPTPEEQNYEMDRYLPPNQRDSHVVLSSTTIEPNTTGPQKT